VILSTGALGTAANPLNNAAVYGVEAALGYENFFLQYYHISVNRPGLHNNGFNGGYVEGSWTLAGEHRKYIPARGAYSGGVYSGTVPEHPFSPWDGQYGVVAVELAGRFGYSGTLFEHQNH
jgi:phosphate-selective porin OprO and OprP